MPTSSSPTRFTERLWGWVRQRCAHPLFWVRVSGESMWPTLIPGRRYLATSLLGPHCGRIVVCANPNEPGLLVKKIDKIAGNKLHIIGLVPWSDSYDVKRDAVYGMIISPRIRR